MEKRKKLVVLTGAGMSAESGIATFRDSGGLWENYDPADVASHDALMSNPELVVAFANDRRKQCAAAQPNEGHRLLAELEKDYDVNVITQNIDDLHERAGSTKVLHLHGELMKCSTYKDPDTPLPLPNGVLEMDPYAEDEHGNRLRPFIVYFGEPVPMMGEAIRLTSKADILLIIGTSLNVYPAAGLVDCVAPGVPVYLIDPNDVMGSSRFHHIRKGGSEGMREFIEILPTL
ncbi:MAG: NAD-dependent deacylase [Porphyromonas sp.]|nr:NAD-dependent deacylase [Porphyromonas sp.]